MKYTTICNYSCFCFLVIVSSSSFISSVFDVGRFKKVQSFEGDTIDYDCITCPHGRTSKTGASVCSTCSTGRMKVGNDANSFTCL